MLPTNRRVRKESFEKVLKDGVFVHSTNLYLRYIDRKDDLPSLFAFVVPNKVKKTSVGRHLIKRRLIAVVEKFLITIKPGFLVVVFVKKDISTLPFVEINKEVLELLKKAKMLNEK
jgi:ribonuclease P protein component